MYVVLVGIAGTTILVGIAGTTILVPYRYDKSFPESQTFLVGLLIRSTLRGKKCTSASTRVQFFQRKIERINRPTRQILL